MYPKTNVKSQKLSFSKSSFVAGYLPLERQILIITFGIRKVILNMADHGTFIRVWESLQSIAVVKAWKRVWVCWANGIVLKAHENEFIVWGIIPTTYWRGDHYWHFIHNKRICTFWCIAIFLGYFPILKNWRCELSLSRCNLKIGVAENRVIFY